MRLCELLARQLDALADLAGALGRPLPQPPLELGEVGRDEDRDAPFDLFLDVQRPIELELENADPPLVRDPLDLGACSVP